MSVKKKVTKVKDILIRYIQKKEKTISLTN